MSRLARQEKRIENGRRPERLRPLLKKGARAIRDMLYGATIWEMVRGLNKERGLAERLFILLLFGDLFGVPVLPSYYTLRLLPYVTGGIAGWKTSLSRPRDLTDLCDQEIG